jgi:hypothetical protein
MPDNIWKEILACIDNAISCNDDEIHHELANDEPTGNGYSKFGGGIVFR